MRRVFKEIIICLYPIYGTVGSLSFLKDFLLCFWRNFRYAFRSLFLRPTFLDSPRISVSFLRTVFKEIIIWCLRKFLEESYDSEEKRVK